MSRDTEMTAAPAYQKWESLTPDEAGEKTTFDASGPGMDAYAGLNDLGGIDMILNLKKPLPSLPKDYAISVPVLEPFVDHQPNPVPPLNILIQIVGSRGDVQPYLSFAIELLMCGHRVRIATHDDFRNFVLVDGKRTLKRRFEARNKRPMPAAIADRLEFFPIGGDPKELMAYMVKNPGLMPGLEAIRNGEISRKQRMLAVMIDNFYLSTHMPDPVSCRPFVADALLCNPPSFAHVHLAEGLGLPLMITFTMPWSPTTAFKHPLVNIKQSNAEPSLTNYLSYGIAEIMTWQGLGRLTNKFRTKRLKLRELANREGPSLADYLKIPHMYCWSPSLIPKPHDWKEHIDIPGFFFLEDDDYEPEPALAAFLAAGPPPIYIGFGSIVVSDPERLTSMIFEAVEATGVRALVSAGWSKLGSNNKSTNVFILGNVPHEWLFSNDRVAAVCHHGGAGTTAAGLRHGRPTIVIPFFGDQPWQGDHVHSAGAGPAPVPYTKLTTDLLIQSIRFALAPEVRIQASKLGDAISREAGEVTGVKSFHAHLPLLNMRCDLNPERVACWWSEELALRLSSVAVETLVRNKCIQRKTLTLHRPREHKTERRELYPLSGGVNAIFQMAVDSVEGTSQLFYKPHKGLFKLMSTVPMFGYRSLVGFSDGLRNLTSAYGSPMQQRQIDDTMSGFKSGGQSLYWGLKEGVGGLVTTPMRQHERYGWQGAVGGVAQALLDVAFKPAAGALALVADPLKGVVMDLTRKSLGRNHPFLGPRTSLDALEYEESSAAERQVILQSFKLAMRGLQERKYGYAALAEEEAQAMQEEAEQIRRELAASSALSKQ